MIPCVQHCSIDTIGKFANTTVTKLRCHIITALTLHLKPCRIVKKMSKTLLKQLSISALLYIWPCKLLSQTRTLFRKCYALSQILGSAFHPCIENTYCNESFVYGWYWLMCRRSWRYTKCLKPWASHDGIPIVQKFMIINYHASSALPRNSVEHCQKLKEGWLLMWKLHWLNLNVCWILWLTN